MTKPGDEWMEMAKQLVQSVEDALGAKEHAPSEANLVVLECIATALAAAAERGVPGDIDEQAKSHAKTWGNDMQAFISFQAGALWAIERMRVG